MTPKFQLFVEQLKAADMPESLRNVLVESVSARAALGKITGMVSSSHPLAGLAAMLLLTRQLIMGDIARLRMLGMPATLAQHSKLVVRALGPLNDDSSVPEFTDDELQEAMTSDLLSPLFGVAAMRPASQAVN